MISEPRADHDSQWLEFRRLRAVALKRAGWRQRRIAEALGVTEGAVSQWLTTAEEQGEEALRARGRPGAPRRLCTEQLQRLPDLLHHGPEAYGFLGEVWTCARVAEVIRREFGVCYHHSHVSRLLKQLGWTPQQPLLRAAQRNDQEIERWRQEVWPALKSQSPKGTP